MPGEHGGIARAWLVFECGTLAADPAAGTLGFGVLEDDGTTVTACPVRVGVDGSFTLHGTRYTRPLDHPADDAGSSWLSSASAFAQLFPAMSAKPSMDGQVWF